MLKLSAEVQTALNNAKPVVALESTIIAHGMPYPDNLRMAQDVETVIRDHGATPATIAIIDGELRAGLSPTELESFARGGLTIPKVSTRDMAYIVAKRATGATTVASTMRISHMAGIHVFATGGIGGAHRGSETDMDISNDLVEFTRSRVAVVTAGAKAILDLALTMEVLETNGVPVVGYETDEFPAFYSRQSGLKVPMRCDTPMEVARLINAQRTLNLSSGIVVANPIPASHEIPASEIAPAIERALAEARSKGILGKQVTPFLLGRLAETTRGRSLAANIALVKNNARLAAEVAVALGKVS
jgi:pseudouridylate synthase